MNNPEHVDPPKIKTGKMGQNEPGIGCYGTKVVNKNPAHIDPPDLVL